jgi:predicted ferric reductase
MATITAPPSATTSASPAPPPGLRPWPARLLLLAMGMNLGAVAALGIARLPVDLLVPGGLATWAGRMTGLLAEVLVLAMVLLVARVPWLERAVGQDRLVRWHRWLAPGALVAIVAHPLLLAFGYAGSSGAWWTSLLSLGSTTGDAVAGTALFLLASAVSVRMVRRRLPYEGWHLLHLTTYGAVLLAFAHQLTAGSTVLQGVLVRGWWTAQLVLVLAAAVVYRVGLSLLRSARHDLRVVGVRRDADDVVTVTVAGRGVDRLAARGGQFLVWRFLDATHWWRAHPFSLSAAPAGDVLRLTAREIGDGTRALTRLRPGTRVLVEGPYGVLTAAARTRDRVLLIGAGLGIAPIRALLEDLSPDVDTVVLQRASHEAEAVLHAELAELAAARPRTQLHLVTGPRGAAGSPSSPLSMWHLQTLVPDVARRDVYLCGPPGLTAQLLDTLHELGLPAGQIHAESFQM